MEAVQAVIEEEITQLESALASARDRLQSLTSTGAVQSSAPPQPVSSVSPSSSTQHSLLLLADSALPLGSFAFSSGLESYLAHHTAKPSFQHFLALSIASLASTALPYVLSAFKDPLLLEELDNNFDASTPCTVARRASIAQGRALLSVWERSLKSSNITTPTANKSHGNSQHDFPYSPLPASEALISFAQAMKRPPSHLGVNGHLPPLWAVVCRSRGISLHESAYVFLLNHAKAIVSAAVRASVLGPYAAQSLLASEWLRAILNSSLQENWNNSADDAGQCAPVLDLWVGRHELLYSRIFNS